MGYPGSHKGTFIVISDSVEATPPDGSSFSKISATGAGNIIVKGNNLYKFETDAYVKKESSDEVTIAMAANQTIEGEFTSVKLTSTGSASGVVAYI